MTNSQIRYQKRQKQYQNYSNRLERDINRINLFKFFILLIGLGTTGFFLITKKYPLSGGALLLGIFLIVYLDIRHRKILQFQQYAAFLRDINEHSLWRLDDRWRSFPDTGDEFRSDQHPYSLDLDIFGKGSLFQWINVTHTFLGRRKLYQLLSAPYAGPAEIGQRQAAIRELAKALSWRQWLSAHGLAVAAKMKDPDFLTKWALERGNFAYQKIMVILVRTLPVLTISFLVLFYYAKVIPFYLPLTTLILQYALLKLNRKKRDQILDVVYGYKSNIELYKDLLGHIEGRSYQSPYLQSLKTKLRNKEEETAGIQLKRLVRIVDNISDRHSGYYSIINLFTLWDYHCLFALEKWKEQSGPYLKQWFEVIGEFEALASLAIIKYDYPDWAVPVIRNGLPACLAKGLGHPLLPDGTRVVNDLQIDTATNVLLITGSNMSGKSTYLRTAGINLVLAYAGAPVCARSFHCSQMDIYTCMRISDNLEKSISTFYAELLRIKMMIEATSNHRPIFFLLDEVFKGTNSKDRHTGAKILIKRLIKKRAIGMVSTHDLELGELESECRTIKNYHFQEFFQNDQLCFDYKLRPGVSTTSNALYLIKAAGIEADE